LAGYRTDSTGNDFTMVRYNICTPSTFSQTVNICAGDTFMVDNSMYTYSGTYIDVVPSASNCDSIITTTLNVLPVLGTTNAFSICEGDTVFVASSMYTLSGTYIDSLSSFITGCDSIVTTNITVTPSIQVSQNPTICNGETFNVGNFVYTISGTYTNTFVSTITGCDSVVTTVLTVLPAIISNQTIELCYGDSFQVGAHNYNVSGQYTDTLTAINSCDSIVYTSIIVHPAIDSTITTISNVISSNEMGATYQWVDCMNANAAIAGEANQSFTATNNGMYAVEITQGFCTVTSSCVSILNVNLNDNSYDEPGFTIAPNPANSQVVISFGSTNARGRLSIKNMQGANVYEEKINAAPTITINVNELPTGIYFVKFVNEQNNIFNKRIQIIK
jgi:hypothetical protein